MSQHSIDIFVHEPKFTCHSDVFAFNKNRKHHWLQKLCISILNKLGCHWYESIVETKRITIEDDTILNLVLKARYSYIRECRQEMKYLIVGDYEHAKLMHECYVQFGYPLAAINEEGFKRCIDMQVILVPWFHGVLLLPEITEKGIVHGNTDFNMPISEGYIRSR